MKIIGTYTGKPVGHNAEIELSAEELARQLKEQNYTVVSNDRVIWVAENAKDEVVSILKPQSPECACKEPNPVVCFETQLKECNTCGKPIPEPKKECEQMVDPRHCGDDECGLCNPKPKKECICDTCVEVCKDTHRTRTECSLYKTKPKVEEPKPITIDGKKIDDIIKELESWIR